MSYIRHRWRLVAASCLVAVALAVAASLAMHKEYTATARIVIEPPAGNDPRSTMVVSPIYLESLRTYEHFATSDSLFEKALDKFDLRTLLGRKPIESLKKRVLDVDIVRNTRILEISAKLPDPRMAQTLAKFLADSTVDMNRSMALAGDRQLVAGMDEQAQEARSRMKKIEDAWSQVLVNEPVNDLQAAAAADARLREELNQTAANTELELADAAERQKRSSDSERVEIRKQAGDAQARLEGIHRKLAILDRQASDREKVLSLRLAHRAQLEAARKAEQTALEASEAHLRETREASGFRSERLTVIDSGVIPERPSSPNLPLNVLAGLLLGLLLPLIYLAVEMPFREQQALSRRNVFHGVGKDFHE